MESREVKVLVRGQSQNATRMHVAAGKFSMLIDEPEQMGGTDAGPSPVQVLLMSLAGCLNVTGHEVAAQRGLKLDGMKIRIEGVMNPCTFLGCSFDERAGFQEIRVIVDADIEGAGAEEINAWLVETENRCPVTDNIKAESNLIVTLPERRR